MNDITSAGTVSRHITQKVFQALLVVSFLFTGHPCVVFSEGNPQAKTHKVRIKQTNVNYNLATLVGEYEFYDPTFYDDYMLSIDGKHVLHFTRIADEIVDFYYYVTDPKEIKSLVPIFKKHKKELDNFSKKIYPTLDVYIKTKPKYKEDGLYRKVSDIVKDTAKTTTEFVIGESAYEARLNSTLYQYLHSNGIKSLKKIKDRPRIVNMLVNKFFMLSTTQFYRDFAHLKVYKDYLDPLNAMAIKQSRPFKAKIYACSTGEEVLSYALEFIEYGITNFTILASDINDSSLLSASDMHYSYGAFDRMPIDIQKRIKKYFFLDKNSGVWELKDPGFFRSRIKFINQDILLDLPHDLEPEFAPPYDLVSIMNVLLYLKNDAVQSRKKYWAKILNENGILVLHDAKYSLLKGWLGVKWAFDNFLMVNSWVNIKTPSSFLPRKKISLYEEVYRDRHSEQNLIALSSAYRLNGQRRKARTLHQEYLKEYPYSYLAMKLIFDEARPNSPKKEKMLNLMKNVHMHQMGTLEVMIQQEKKSSEKKYLNKLSEVYKEFLSRFKNVPEKAETLFDFTVPRSKKYGYLQKLLKAHAFTLFQNFYSETSQSNDFVRVSQEGLSMAEEIVSTRPDCLAALHYLNVLLYRLGDYYVNEGKYDEVLALGRRGLGLINHYSSHERYFYLQDGLGNMHLNNAYVYKNRSQWTEMKTAAEKAAGYYRKAKNLLQNIPFVLRSDFYTRMGRSFMLVGEYYIHKKDHDQAEANLTLSLKYFDMVLEMNSLYEKEAGRFRNEVLKIAAKAGLLPDIRADSLIDMNLKKR